MNDIIAVRGAGDLATGVAHKLYRSGFRVLLLELEEPLVIRKTVSFAQANPFAAAAAAIILLFILWRRPKLFLTLVVLALIAVGIMQLFDRLTDTGLPHKKIPFVE